MVSKTVTVINEEGLTLKSAANFCKAAVGFESLITFTFGNSTANAKSVISVLGSCVRCGDSIEIVCDGADEEEALAAMCKAVEEGLPDDETGMPPEVTAELLLDEELLAELNEETVSGMLGASEDA